MPKQTSPNLMFPLSDEDLNTLGNSLSNPLPSRDRISHSDIASLTVSDMKTLLKYINDHKLEPRMKLRTTGKKNELKCRLEKYLWPDKRQGVILASRDERLGSLKRPKPALCRRVITYAETMNRKRIENDPTLNGKQDPYYVIDSLLDLINITQRSGKVELTIDLNSTQMERIKTKQYDIHLYWLSASLNPHNWQDATVSWNDSKLPLPKSNRKLRKKLKKKVLITSTPLIIPQSIVRAQNICTILHPHWIQLDGNLIVTMVRNYTTDELISKVKHRTEIWKKEQEEEEKQRRANRIETGTEDLIISDDEIITLNDALTLERVEEPCRGKNCRHKTCFDLESYLEYCHASNVWNCPVCDTPLRYEDLIIDYNIKRIISEVNPDVEKVRLHGDGSYTLILPPGMTIIGEEGEEQVVSIARKDNNAAPAAEPQPVDDVQDDEETVMTESLGAQSSTTPVPEGQSELDRFLEDVDMTDKALPSPAPQEHVVQRQVPPAAQPQPVAEAGSEYMPIEID